MNPSKFKELVLGNWFYCPRLEERQYEKITKQNGFEKVKLKLLNLSVEEKPISDRIQAVMDLREVGPFIASQFFLVINDQIIFCSFFDNILAFYDCNLDFMKEMLKLFCLYS